MRDYRPSCPNLGIEYFCYARAVYVETNGTVRTDIFVSECKEASDD